MMKTTIKQTVNLPTTRFKLQHSTTGKHKIKLERYSKGKQLNPGRYIGVFGKDKGVKLLNTNQLLPNGVAPTTLYFGKGKQFVETFHPQYGYGSSSVPGRFLFWKSTIPYIDMFGWKMDNAISGNQELEFYLFMDEISGPQPSPAENSLVLEIHVICTPYIYLDIAVNGTVVRYLIDPGGESRILLYLRKSSAMSLPLIKIKFLPHLSNPGTSIWINRIDLYKTIVGPVGDLNTL